MSSNFGEIIQKLISVFGKKPARGLPITQATPLRTAPESGDFYTWRKRQTDSRSGSAESTRRIETPEKGKGGPWLTWRSLLLGFSWLGLIWRHEYLVPTLLFGITWPQDYLILSELVINDITITWYSMTLAHMTSEVPGTPWIGLTWPNDYLVSHALGLHDVMSTW
jgi:hypothetical protein